MIGSRTLDRLYGLIPLFAAFFWVALLYGWQTRGHVTPWLFTDELKYTHISRSIAHTGLASERHHSVSFDTLYTYFIAPFWWIKNVHTAYSAIKYAGALAMCLAIFPTYLLARMVVSKPWALFAAVAAVVTPSLAYASFILEEPIAYPTAALGFYLIAKSLVVRSKGWIAAASIVALFATFVRGELAVLIVVYVLSVVFLLWTSEKARRWRSGWTAWDWIGFVVLAIGGAIVFSAIVGAFSQSWFVSTGYYRHRMIVYGLWAAGAFTIGVGLLPVLALAALARPKGEQWTRELRAYVSVTAAAVLTFGFYTAVKAAFLSTVFSTVVEERNLIYLAPLCFIAMALALERRRMRWWALAGTTALVLYCVISVPYQLNLYPYADALGFGIVQLANRDLAFNDGDVTTLLIIAVVVLLALLLTAFLAGKRRYVGLGATLAAVGLVLAWNVTGEVAASNGVNNFSQALLKNFPTPPTWIDQATGGKPAIYLGKKITDPQGIWLMEFWNKGLTYVWSLDGTAPPPGRRAPGYVTPDMSPNGTLTGKSIPIGNPPGVNYMVADNDIQVAGKKILRPQVQSVITQDAYGFPIHKVVTTAAPWRLLRISRPLRLTSAPVGIDPDGWVTPPLGAQHGTPAFAAYNQFSSPTGKPGWIKIVVSRSGWQGKDKPGNVTIKVGQLVRGPDKQPALGNVRQVIHYVTHAGKTRIFYVPADPPTRIELTVSPTFEPYQFGGSDRRDLGAEVSFGFTPKRS
jgi:hypothetical protein